MIYQYVTKPGDTLNKLSEKYYGDYELWYEIFEKNLKVPGISLVPLIPGTVIQMPESLNFLLTNTAGLIAETGPMPAPILEYGPPQPEQTTFKTAVEPGIKKIEPVTFEPITITAPKPKPKQAGFEFKNLILPIALSAAAIFLIGRNK